MWHFEGEIGVAGVVFEWVGRGFFEGFVVVLCGELRTAEDGGGTVGKAGGELHLVLHAG